jgi:hypothetical protein
MYVRGRSVLCRENGCFKLLLEAVCLGSVPAVEPHQLNICVTEF